MGQVRDRDLVTLQTCTLPDLDKRLIVGAERVEA
jgi:sortase (surface protein transpeptidase)